MISLPVFLCPYLIKSIIWSIAKKLALRHPEEEAEPVPDLAESARRYIDAHYMEPVTVAGIAAALFVTPAYLGQVFRKAMNMTIRQYLMTVRIERTKELLERTSLHVYEIADRVGFAESKYLVACFQKETGLSPAAWRREKAGK